MADAAVEAFARGAVFAVKMVEGLRCQCVGARDADVGEFAGYVVDFGLHLLQDISGKIYHLTVAVGDAIRMEQGHDDIDDKDIDGAFADGRADSLGG